MLRNPWPRKPAGSGKFPNLDLSLARNLRGRGGAREGLGPRRFGIALKGTSEIRRGRSPRPAQEVGERPSLSRSPLFPKWLPHYLAPQWKRRLRCLRSPNSPLSRFSEAIALKQPWCHPCKANQLNHKSLASSVLANARSRRRVAKGPWSERLGEKPLISADLHMSGTMRKGCPRMTRRDADGEHLGGMRRRQRSNCPARSGRMEAP